VVQVASLQPPPVASTSEPESEPAQNDTQATGEPSGQAPAIPVSGATHLYVQAGAFSSRDNAERLRTRLAEAEEVFVSAEEQGGRPLYRVRSGPYDDLEAANAALARLSGLGNNDAKIVVDR